MQQASLSGVQHFMRCCLGNTEVKNAVRNVIKIAAVNVMMKRICHNV